MEEIVAGILGLGTVGSGTARLLREGAERIARRAGKRIRLKCAVVRDLAKPRDLAGGEVRLSAEPRDVIDDPEIGVVVETMGGIEPAIDFVKRAIANGKDVVTANKALLAERGEELFEHARKHGRAIAFEASVGGGIPIVQALEAGLAANRIVSLSAIVNGTCNYILTSMTREGISYPVALGRARELGFAEADPTLDVDGTDTAHKLAVLAQLAFNVNIKTAGIPRVGIDRLQPADIAYAGELGYIVKLLALAKNTEAGLVLRVAPTLVRKGTPLAEVSGPYNAVRVVGDAVGDTLFYGRGAGALPTASAVVGDLIDVASGRAKITFDVLGLWSPTNPPPRLAPSIAVRSRYYLRFTIADRPGVLASLAKVLGEHDISIAGVVQHDPGDDALDAPVPLVITTHVAAEAQVHQALDEIDRLEVVRAPTVRLGVEE